MKRINKKTLFLGALATLLLTACSSEQDTPQQAAGGSRAAFTATIGAATRAYDQSWEASDRIGITGKSGEVEYNNVAYVTTGDGNFKAETDGTEIYFQDDAPVTFTACYPWNASTTVTANTLEQSKQKTFDFLYAQGTGSKASPKVAFRFTHCMAKVVLTIKKGADVSFDEVKAALPTLGGFMAKGEFDGLTGGTSLTSTGTATLAFAGNAPKTENDDESVSYTLILFPQEFSGKLPFSAKLEGRQTFKTELDFTEANRRAGDETPGNYWTTGRQYNLSVMLNKTALVVDGCTIAPWEEANGGNVDAD